MICIHFVISEMEEVDQVLSQIQIGERAIPSQPAPVSTILIRTTRPALIPRQINPAKDVTHTSMTSDEENSLFADLLPVHVLNQATCSTSKIFAPKTKDTDTGFLMPINLDGHENKLISEEEP